jgi:hypothetical protein
VLPFQLGLWSSHTSGLGGQIADFEDEQGASMPAVVRLNGTAARVLLHRLVMFTGDRFLRSAACAGSGDKRQKTGGLSSDGLSFPADELPAAKMMFDMMEDDPPERLTIRNWRACWRSASSAWWTSWWQDLKIT